MKFIRLCKAYLKGIISEKRQHTEIKDGRKNSTELKGMELEATTKRCEQHQKVVKGGRGAPATIQCD